MIETEYGTLTGSLFRPASASSATPAPAVVTSHGYLNNREMQDCNWIELARRGYVVFAMDAYGHGDSSVVSDAFADVPNVMSGGMIDAVEYLYALPFVDIDAIGVTGHSMGGGFTNTTLDYYTALERQALADGATDVEAHALNKIKAGVIVGNYPTNLGAEDNVRRISQRPLCDRGEIRRVLRRLQQRHADERFDQARFLGSNRRNADGRSRRGPNLCQRRQRLSPGDVESASVSCDEPLFNEGRRASF
ncbi:MAG: alpha/beta fold hydrolase [Comamonadaceae bacterium]|nr:alpha/beta fold hydrolase [Comamonadaceae bacterium]